MNKKEWQEHSKWLDSFRGKIISKYNENGEEKTYKKIFSCSSFGR